MLSGRGLCEGLITRPEESYRVWCVLSVTCEAWKMSRPWSTRVVVAWKKMKLFNLVTGENLILQSNFVDNFSSITVENSKHHHCRCLWDTV